MKKGTLIAFTGIDGSGKTTQADLLVKNLLKDGIEASYVWSRWEPFLVRPFIAKWKEKKTNCGDKIGDQYNGIRVEKQRLLENPLFRWLWLISFFIDYGIQIFVRIRIGLLRKQLIISDRTFYDSIIDQVINLGERGDWLLDSIASFWMKIIFPEPNMIIFVDCPPDIAFSRKEDAPNVGYLIERRTLYVHLAERYGWSKVDGTLPVDKIAQQIRQIVSKQLSA
jgi:dTMP kinase